MEHDWEESKNHLEVKVVFCKVCGFTIYDPIDVAPVSEMPDVHLKALTKEWLEHMGDPVECEDYLHEVFEHRNQIK